MRACNDVCMVSRYLFSVRITNFRQVTKYRYIICTQAPVLSLGRSVAVMAAGVLSADFVNFDLLYTNQVRISKSILNSLLQRCVRLATHLTLHTTQTQAGTKLAIS
jgi:hypothetical protein